jgi:hypothetical protein
MGTAPYATGARGGSPPGPSVVLYDVRKNAIAPALDTAG